MASKWDQLHANYSTQSWIDTPNIFAEEVLEYLPKDGTMLLLGDGLGQDGRFFATKGYRVVSTDISDRAIEANGEKAKLAQLPNYEVKRLDLLEPFPFDDASFDIVYAHLSIHYFDEKTTSRIFHEMKRVLKKGGILAIFTNSVSDPEFNT